MKRIFCKWTWLTHNNQTLWICLDFLNNPRNIECDFFVGKCYPDGHEVIIVPKYTHYNIKGSTWTIEIDFLFEFKNEVEYISKINFIIKEIDYIYNVNMSIMTEKPLYNSDGSMEINLKPYNETISEKQRFKIEDNEIICYFNIGRFFSIGGNEPLINIYSYLCFEFEETNDYEFLVRLYLIAIKFIQFLCYRENISIKKIVTQGKYEEGYAENGRMECFRNITNYRK